MAKRISDREKIGIQPWILCIASALFWVAMIIPAFKGYAAIFAVLALASLVLALVLVLVKLHQQGNMELGDTRSLIIAGLLLLGIIIVSVIYVGRGALPF